MTKPRQLLLAIGATALGFALVLGVTAQTPRAAPPSNADPTRAGVAAVRSSATGLGVGDRAFSCRARASAWCDLPRMGR
jgi:hypothetical protein